MVTKQKGLIRDEGNDHLDELSPSSKASRSKLNEQRPKVGKKQLKTLYLRIPENFWEDIQTIANLTGLSMNAVCMDLLRPAIKSKLKVLKEE